MRKFISICVITCFSVSVFAQADTTKLTADTNAVNKSKSNFIDVAKDLITNSNSQKSLDSIKAKTTEAEGELKRLEEDVNRNAQNIRSKKNELKNLAKDKKEIENKIKEYKETMDLAIADYDIMKNKIVKMQNDSATLASQQETIKKKSDSLTVKTNATQTEYNRLLLEISKKEDSLEAIALIKLKSEAVIVRADPKKYKQTQSQSIYLSQYSISKEKNFDLIRAEIKGSNPEAEADSVKISKVHLSVKEGRIAEIIVKTNRGIFRNLRSQIDLVHFAERRYSDKLFKDEESPNDLLRTFMYPGDAIIYEPVRSFGDIPYSEFEITLTPDSSGNTYIIRENSSINTYFEVAAFTDVNGVAGNANGLAQITASAKFITSTRNSRNKTLMGLQYIAFNGGLAKFDNDFKGTFISEKDSVDRKDLFQRSQYAVGIKANILRWVRSPYPSLLFNDLQINVGFNFLGSRIADTVSKKTDTLFKTITQNQIYIEPIMTFSRQKNFSMSVGLPIFHQNIKKSAGISNTQWEWWICPSINLMYYSNRDSKSKVFFRYNHFVNLNNKKKAFNQLQLGFAANLTNVMQGK